MESQYLINAVAIPEGIRLTFLDPSTNSENYVVDKKYTPYFFSSYPLDPHDKLILDDLSTETRILKKIDLITGKTRKIIQIRFNDLKEAKRTSKRFKNSWEGEIPLELSYVYDKDLVFGALHQIKAGVPKLDYRVPEKLTQEFEKAFHKPSKVESSKIDLLKRWLSLCYQPIPQLPSSFFNIQGSNDTQRIALAFILSRVANLPLQMSLTSNQVSAWIKSILHNYLRRKNILIPTSKELRRGEHPKSIKGALTYHPIPGVYFNTYVVDFESLYPSIIDVKNLSYETINCSHEECRTNTVPGLTHCVCRKRRGVYSILIGSIKALRIRWFKKLARNKKIHDNERTHAQVTSDFLKLILVSSYGVTIRIHGLACPPLAESVTAYGRYSLQKSWNLAEKIGLHPIYGDTDSLFLDNPRKKQVDSLIKRVENQLQLSLIIDKVYSLCVLPKAMKAYFGVKLDGTPELKGITAMKSNTPAFIQKVFEDCMNELSNSTNYEDFRRSKERVQNVIENSIRRLIGGKIPLDELKYTVKLHDDPKLKINRNIIHQPYQCAIQIIDSGKILKKGDSVSFIKVKPFNYRGKTFTVKPFKELEESSEFEVNIDDYVRNLQTALNQTLKILDLRFDQSNMNESEKSVTLSDFI